MDICETIPKVLMGDEKRITQVTFHLLTNAIKFSPVNSKINLSVTKLSEENDIITLKIDVSDNGIGISEEQQKSLFTLFEQVDGGNTRKYGGAGIGLPLSKRLAEMMDGSISVDSELGKGSRFGFTCKVKKA